jgi:predicted N-acetyltransferase YhbS
VNCQSFEISSQADQPGVEALLDKAFGLSRRTKTSYRLREGNQPVRNLTRVLRDSENGIAATISYWPITIGAARTKALLLGPLAVHPACKGRGIGLQLMRETLDAAREEQHRLVLLVGDEPYYARVGFKLLPTGRLSLPGPFDPSRFLYLELARDALQGVSGLVIPPHRAAL